MTRLVGAGAALALVALGCSVDNSPPEFLLEEVGRLTLDPEFGAPAGLGVSDDGRLVLWTDNRVFAEVDGALEPLRLKGVLYPVAVWGEGGRTVVVDGMLEERLEFPELDELVARVGVIPALGRQPIGDPSPGTRIIGAAGGGDCGTIVAQTDSVGVVSVGRVGASGTVESVAGGWGGGRDGWLAGNAPGALLLTQADTPFTSFTIDCGSVTQTFGIALESGFLAEDGQWRSLSPAVSESFAFRTVSDVLSDRRWLVSFDSDGVEARRVLVNTPLAIVSASQNGKYAIGVQSLGSTEIVKYRVSIERR